jgi:hypothetical protein
VVTLIKATARAAARLRASLSRRLRRAYREPMAVAPRPGLPPEDDASLDAYPGQYVALLDGKVVVSDADPDVFVRRVRELGEAGQRARLTRVPAPSEAAAVGVG